MSDVLPPPTETPPAEPGGHPPTAASGASPASPVTTQPVTTPPTAGTQGRLSAWVEVLRTTNPPSGRALDPVSRWLVLTRAAVLPMTLVAGAVATLLAVHRPGFRPGLLVLAFVGLVLAHVANNLMNDLFDEGVGADTATYPRALYAPHPVLSGMATRTRLAGAALLVNVFDLGILVVLALYRGWPVVGFALGGFLLSVAYTAPPLRLKKRGLGEPDVFLVWGPLMVCGTYYSAVGHLPWEIVVASVPYGLLCTAVLMGKHIDKAPYDEPLGIRTLPVLLGERRARVPPRAAHGLLLRHRRVVRSGAGPAVAGTAEPGGDPQAGPGVEGVQRTQARRPPAPVPRVAVVVRGRRLRAHQAGRVPARAGSHRGRHRRHPLTHRPVVRQ